MTNGGDALPDTVPVGAGEVGGSAATPGLVARLRRSVLGIPDRETRPERRGFHVVDGKRTERLVRVGESFLAGYHAALLDARPQALARAIESEVEVGWRGFAHEGAGMALALQDALFPRRSRRPTRLQDFLAGPARLHRYLVVVGAGWTFARLPRRYGRALAGLDPLLKWLAFDGYGFHHGYFGWRRAVEGQRVPRRLRGYARRVFDQGLGRSLWFVQGMAAERIAATIEAFPRERRGDLWSGVGLASAFAGGLATPELGELRRLAGPWAPHAAQGIAFAAKARVESGEETPWLEGACAVFCDARAAEVAAVTDRLARDLPADGGSLAAAEPAYEVWRCRTRDAVASACETEREEASP